MVPRWLPLYLLGIAALTLFPFAPGICPGSGWVMHLSGFDFVANLLVFAPIGVALHRSSGWRVVGFAFALSLAIELCQRWLPRQQDLSDVIANTLGAAVGYVLARAWARRWPGPLLRAATVRLALWIATPVLLLLLLFESLGSSSNDFANWEHYPLVLGNSSSGSRPWTGTLKEIAIYDRDLRDVETPASTAAPGEPSLWMDGGPILWLRFSGDDVSGRVDGPGGPVRYAPEIDPASTVLRSGLHLRPSGITLAQWVSDHVVDRLRKSGRLSVDVRMRTDVERQYGPAYLLSLDDGRRLQDLTLAQMGSGFVAGIRTPANGRTGARAQPETRSGLVTTTDEHRVRLGFDGVHAVIRVDGRCEAVSDLVLSNAPLLRGPLLGAAILLCTALPALLVGGGSRGTGRRLAVGIAAGVATWLACWAFGAWDHIAGFTPIAAAGGLLAIAACVPLLVARPR